jgi:glyoxylase-like metal-dependent hydrolase (beta-lactamase superfamily II)
MQETVPGAFHWTARHPGIGMDVSSYFIERSGTLIDPMTPAEGVSWFRDRPPRLIVLTIRHHYRDSEAFVEEFGIEVWCHENGLHEFENGPPVRGFETGDTLAPGIEALPLNAISPDDVVLGIDVGGGAVAFGDGLVNWGGRIGFVPDQLIGDDSEAVKRATRAAIQPLLDRDFEHLFFAHGDPIVGDGRRRLAEFLQK